jgi:dynein heavy chain
MKELGKEKDTNPKWLVLDGDLDANWIESMNSVMDDNRILTLANSDRIILYPHMRMLLEIRDLRFATPATVSRGGVIYIYDQEGWQWRSYVESWLEQCSLARDMQAANMDEGKQREVIDTLRNFIVVKYMPKMLEHMKRSFKRPFPMYDISLVMSTLKIFDAIFSLGTDEDRKNLNFLEQWFGLAAIWAFGGSVSLFEGEDYKKAFSKFFLTEYKGVMKMNKSCFDCYIDPKTNEFYDWSEMLKDTPFDSSKQSITSVVVDTSETTAYSYFINKLIKTNSPTLIIGPTGSGKSQLINGVLQKLPPSK